MALARGSKMSYSANGVPSQVRGLNWNSPYDPPGPLTAVGTVGLVSVTLGLLIGVRAQAVAAQRPTLEAAR